MKLAVLKAFREHPEARRLALIFGVVYFAQGMWNLPVQPITFTLKERFGFSAAGFTALCWLLVPLLKLEELETQARQAVLTTPASASS